MGTLEHRVTRRRLLKAGIYAGIGLSAVGCQSSPAPGTAPTTSAAKPNAPAAQPTAASVASKPAAATVAPSTARKPTGALVEAVSSLGNERWLPNLGSAQEMEKVAALYEFLLYNEPGGTNLTPGLAEKWEMSKDGLTWTFNLRKGVPWHDGYGEFTADDVKFTYDLSTSQGSVNAAITYFRDFVGSLEVADPYKVVFHLKKPSFELGYRLCVLPPGFPIVSKKYVEKVGVDQATRHPVGTGPYKFVEHKVGDHITFEALDQHWRVVPYYKTFTIRAVPEDATRVAMLKAGEADIIEMNPLAKADLEKSGLRVMMIPNAASLHVWFGGMWTPTSKGFDTSLPWVGPEPNFGGNALKVRRALNYALDRKQIVQTVLAGAGEPMSVPILAPTMSQYDPSWVHPYDVDQAKKLLAEAGYPNGFEAKFLSYATLGRPQGPVVAGAVATYWDKIGVRVRPQQVEYEPIRQANRNKSFKDIGITAPNRMPDPVTFLLNQFTIDTPFLMGAEVPQLDKTIKDAASELDEAKRYQLERQAYKFIFDNALVAPIASLHTTYGVSNKVGRWSPPAATYMVYQEYVTP